MKRQPKSSYFLNALTMEFPSAQAGSDDPDEPEEAMKHAVDALVCNLLSLVFNHKYDKSSLPSCAECLG